MKIHCSVLAEDAIKAAIDDYKKKQEPTQRRSDGELSGDGDLSMQVEP